MAGGAALAGVPDPPLEFGGAPLAGGGAGGDTPGGVALFCIGGELDAGGAEGDGAGTADGGGTDCEGAGTVGEGPGTRTGSGTGTVAPWGGVPIPGAGAEPPGFGAPLTGGFPAAWPAGTVAGKDCVGTVGAADGVTLCTATRTFSMSELINSSVKLGRPRGSLTMTLPPSPSSTL